MPLGKVHIVAKPMLERKTQRLILTGVNYGVKTDHPFWSDQNLQLSDNLLQQFKTQAQYHYGTDINLVTQTAKVQPWFELDKHMSIGGELTQLKPYRLILAEQALVVDMGAKGLVKVKLKLPFNLQDCNIVAQC